MATRSLVAEFLRDSGLDTAVIVGPQSPSLVNGLLRRILALADQSQPAANIEATALAFQISVMGFDSTFESIDHDLTSYDLNFLAAAATALHFLLRPNAAHGNRRLLRPEIEGFVVSRGTTSHVSS